MESSPLTSHPTSCNESLNDSQGIMEPEVEAILPADLNMQNRFTLTRPT